MAQSRRDPGPEPEKSKSQKKRESTALQGLGEELAGLDQARLASLPLSPDLQEALGQVRTIRSHEAKRRHMQYIGRLMREIDPEPVQALLAAMRDEGSRDSARFRRIEAWRDRMAAGDGSALDEVAEAFGLADERQLRQLAQLAKSAGEEAAGGKPPHASRKLFRALRALDEAARRAGEDPAGQP